jgi:glycolate oxidase FAD binding subunit
MTEISIKVLPAQREMRTIVCFGLTDPTAVEALSIAASTPFAVSGTLHAHADLAKHFSDERISGAGAAVTAVRVESFPASARYRANRLRQLLAAYSPVLELDNAESRAFWGEVRGLKMFQATRLPLWRISTLPTGAAKFVGNLSRKIEVRPAYDCAGGIVWLETPPLTDAGAVDIRRTLAEFGGHATLIRADATARAGIDVFQPLDTPMATLTAKLKQAFDPEGILNPGRMYPGI